MTRYALNSENVLELYFSIENLLMNIVPYIMVCNIIILIVHKYGYKNYRALILKVAKLTTIMYRAFLLKVSQLTTINRAVLCLSTF